MLVRASHIVGQRHSAKSWLQWHGKSGHFRDWLRQKALRGTLPLPLVLYTGTGTLQLTQFDSLEDIFIKIQKNTNYFVPNIGLGSEVGNVVRLFIVVFNPHK